MCALTALVRSPFSGLSLHNNVMVERTARARAVATFHLNGAAVVPRGTSRKRLTRTVLLRTRLLRLTTTVVPYSVTGV